MRETPSKMHMNDMVNIDTIVFEIVCGGGGGAFRGHLRIVIIVSNTPDRIRLSVFITRQIQ